MKKAQVADLFAEYLREKGYTEIESIRFEEGLKIFIRERGYDVRGFGNITKNTDTTGSLKFTLSEIKKGNITKIKISPYNSDMLLICPDGLSYEIKSKLDGYEEFDEFDEYDEEESHGRINAILGETFKKGKASNLRIDRIINNKTSKATGATEKTEDKRTDNTMINLKTIISIVLLLVAWKLYKTLKQNGLPGPNFWIPVIFGIFLFLGFRDKNSKESIVAKGKKQVNSTRNVKSHKQEAISLSTMLSYALAVVGVGRVIIYSVNKVPPTTQFWAWLIAVGVTKVMVFDAKNTSLGIKVFFLVIVWLAASPYI